MRRNTTTYFVSTKLLHCLFSHNLYREFLREILRGEQKCTYPIIRSCDVFLIFLITLKFIINRLIPGIICVYIYIYIYIHIYIYIILFKQYNVCKKKHILVIEDFPSPIILFAPLMFLSQSSYVPRI